MPIVVWIWVARRKSFFFFSYIATIACIMYVWMLNAIKMHSQLHAPSQLQVGNCCFSDDVYVLLCIHECTNEFKKTKERRCDSTHRTYEHYILLFMQVNFGIIIWLCCLFDIEILCEQNAKRKRKSWFQVYTIK